MWPAPPRRGAAGRGRSGPGDAGVRLAEEKTHVVHIDEGFDFLDFTIRRMRKRGTQKHYVYTVPSKKAIQAVKDKVSARRTGQPGT